MPALVANPKSLLIGAGALAAVGLGVGAVALLRDDNLPRSGEYAPGRGGRAHERHRGITGSEKQYKRSGGGDVRYTKGGQPYVLDATGRPKFVRRSR